MIKELAFGVILAVATTGSVEAQDDLKGKTLLTQLFCDTKGISLIYEKASVSLQEVNKAMQDSVANENCAWLNLPVPATIIKSVASKTDFAGNIVTIVKVGEDIFSVVITQGDPS